MSKCLFTCLLWSNMLSINTTIFRTQNRKCTRSEIQQKLLENRRKKELCPTQRTRLEPLPFHSRMEGRGRRGERQRQRGGPQAEPKKRAGRTTPPLLPHGNPHPLWAFYHFYYLTARPVLPARWAGQEVRRAGRGHWSLPQSAIPIKPCDF